MYGTGIPSPYQLLGQGVNALGQGLGSLYNQVTQGQQPRGNQPPQGNNPNYPSMYQPGKIYGDPRAFDPVNDPRYPSMYQPGRIYGDPEAFDDPQKGAAIQEDGAPRMSNQETRQQDRPIPTQEELAERDYQNRAVTMAQQVDPYMSGLGSPSLRSQDPRIAMMISESLYGQNFAAPKTVNPMLQGMPMAVPMAGTQANAQNLAQQVVDGIGNPDASTMGNVPFGMQQGMGLETGLDTEAAKEFLAKYKFFEPR